MNVASGSDRFGGRYNGGGPYRFHRLAESAPYPPLAPPGSTRGPEPSSPQSLARARTLRTLLGYQLEHVIALPTARGGPCIG
jgi:hypothetical protein